MKKYCLMAGIMTVMAAVGSSCQKSETPVYGMQRNLYFQNENGRDTLRFSFFHNPGADFVEVKFPVNLLGRVSDKPLEYRVVFVDTLSKVKTNDYECSEKQLFGAGLTTDTFRLRLNRTAHLKNESSVVVFRLVTNENFAPGFSDRLQVKVTFNDIENKPLWWDDEVDEIYFGVYSREKYAALYQATGKNSIVGLEPSEIRLLALKLKKHIEDNHLTDMTVPCY